MAVSIKSNAFVVKSAQTISLSQIITTTASASDPAYLVVTGLDRDEYTAGASDLTGSLSGDGATADFTNIGGDGRGLGVVFTYQASTGRYYNSTYGYLDQATYTASASKNDLTSLSFFSSNNLALANAYADNAYAMMQVDASGYLGSATIATQPGFTAPVPSQATPDSIAAVADSFVGQAWNNEGCWVLASTIATEAGAALPVQSTAIGVPGVANGEWIVAYNGPAGQTGDWQSLVHAGEIVVFGTPGGGGHVTTVVSGSGGSAELVDNITYVNGSGQILDSANDGQAADIIVAAPHAASQEWAGVQASSVVIYELDTPVVTDLVASLTLGASARDSLASLFSATDPAGNAITEYQVYDSSTTDSLLLGGVDEVAHSAGGALTVASLASLSLAGSPVAGSDTLEVRAFNGTYWGDWQSLTVTLKGAVAPVQHGKIAAQNWVGGSHVTLTVPTNNFVDPQGETLTYSATLSDGTALPSWLVFNAATHSFTGIAPVVADISPLSLGIMVTATDTSGLSNSEVFLANVKAGLVLANPVATQSWVAGSNLTDTLASNMFVDAPGDIVTLTAGQINGKSATAWLHFDSTTNSFSGAVPAGVAGTTIGLQITATDDLHRTATQSFTVSFGTQSGGVGALTSATTVKMTEMFSLNS